MIANYHTHTWRCNHARGTEDAYVASALEAGMELLGFSDHAPYLFPGDYYSSFRMTPEQMEDYVSTVLSLRRAYAGRIEIPLGLEMEYYPRHFRETMEFLRDHPLDYLILGQHFLDNEYDSPWGGLDSGDEALLKQYVAQSRDAMQTGLFTYFAHPDVVHFRGSEKIYREQMALLCREANSCGLPLECNLLGLATGRHYPSLPFWETAAQEGCAVILGCDAHSPKALLNRKNMENARNFLSRLGLTPIDKVRLRPPRL